MIRAVGNNIVAVPIESGNQTKSGLFLPQQASKELETRVAKVTSMGPTASPDIKVGDTILYKPYATFDVKLKDKEHILVLDEDVLAVVDDGQ